MYGWGEIIAAVSLAESFRDSCKHRMQTKTEAMEGTAAPTSGFSIDSEEAKALLARQRAERRRKKLVYDPPIG